MLDVDVLLTHFGIWMLVESNDKPYAGQPVGNKAEEYHQQAQYNSTILGQPKHKYISVHLRQMNTIQGQNVYGQNVYRTKRLWDKTSKGTKGLREKRSDGTKRKRDKMSIGTKHLMRQNV